MATTNTETMKLIIQIQDETRARLKSLANALKDLETPAKRSSRAINILAEGVERFKTGIRNLRQQVFTLKNAVLGAVAAFGLWKVYSFVKNVALLAARYKTLGVTLEVIGKQAGYNAQQLEEFEEGLKKTGIAAIEARTVLARMIQAQLDLTKSTELARVAQNAAVIANLNSSETLTRMLHAIQANSVEILRTIGMNVSFEKSYKVLAKQLDLNVNQLTEAQKTQARFNAVLQGGVQIAGAYESAMTTAAKKIQSFTRYVQNFRVAVGEAFEPALAIIVDAATQAMKEFTAAVKDPAFQKNLAQFANVMGEQVKAAFTWLIDNKEAILNVITEITKSIGDAILSLNRLYEILLGSQKRILQEQQKSFEKVTTALAGYIAKRDELQAKLDRWKANAESSNANLLVSLQDEFDFGKTEREIKRLDSLITEFTALSKKAKENLDKVVEPPKENKLKEYWDDILLAIDTTGIPKDPLGSSVMVSDFKRATADIKRELEILASEYENHVISLGLYYDERERLAAESFRNELKYLEGQAAKQQDPDKRLKIEDKIYALRLQYHSKETALRDERRKAVKSFADERLEIERSLQTAKIALLEKSKTSTEEEVNRAQIDQLKITQVERLKTLVESQASDKQIEERKALDQLEIQLVKEEQERKHVERVKEIRSILQDARDEITYQTGGEKELFKLEEQDLLRSQEEQLKVLRDSKATRDEIKELEITQERQRQLLSEDQQKRSSQKILETQRVLEDARLALIDPNNMQAVFDAQMINLERQQANRLQSIKDAKLNEGAELAAIEEANRISQLEKDRLHAEQRLAIQKKFVDGVGGILSSLNSAFGDMYEISGRETKKWFHLQKAVAVAQATIATYESAVQAYKSMAGIPYVGPYLGAAAAAVAVAAGLAKVAVIRSQSYAEGGEVKGYSPTSKSDNIQANLTAGEFVHPVDVVKYYGVKGMEIIRQKLIPPELLYQISSFSEKKESIKQSFENNLNRTNDFVKDYSKRILDISKRFSDKSSSDGSLVSKSNRTVSDRQEVIITKLFEKLVSDRYKFSDLKSTSIIDKSSDTSRIFLSDRIASIYKKDYYKDSESSDNKLVIKKKTKKKKYKYISDQKQDLQSRIHVASSVHDRESFLNTMVKASITKDKMESVIREVIQNSTTIAGRSIIDKVIDRSITDKLMSDKLVDKAVVSQSLIDSVVNRLAIDSSHLSDSLINKSHIREIIERSVPDEVRHGFKTEVNATYVDKAISELVKERIKERSMIQNANIQRDKLFLSSDSRYVLDSKNQVDFTKSLSQSASKITEISKSRELIADSKVKDLRDSVYKSKDTTIIEKSISFVKDIGKTIERIIPTVNPQPVMVMSPVVIKDTISKTESFTKLKTKQLKNMNIASSFIKMIEERTSQTMQQLAGGGQVRGHSPHSRADNIIINATAGEFMHPVDVVKYYGIKGMEVIKQKLIPREVIAQYANNIQLPKPNYTHAFAMGGEIPKTRETSGSAEDKAKNNEINITNLVDPALFDQYLASSPGEQQMLNVITSNKYQIKGILES